MTVLSLSLKARRGALDLDVALDLEAGPVALVGPNGAGKTSLLRWLAGDDFPVQAASLRVRGETWVDSRAGVFVPPEARRVGYVPQTDSLVSPLTVRDNVAFGLRARGATRAEAREGADAALARWGITELGPRRPDVLSGGERQKVALARAMVTEPRVLLLDEPTSSLDPGARRSMRLRLREASQGRPTVIVTHDVRDVRSLCTLVVVLEGGRVVQRGTPAELTKDPATPFVVELFEPLTA